LAPHLLPLKWTKGVDCEEKYIVTTQHALLNDSAHDGKESCMEATILLVEADAMTRGLLDELLRGAGYQVATTSCGYEADTLLRQGTWDLVITELELPDDTGLGLLATAKELVPAPAVLVQSSCGSFEGVLAALRGGAVDYLRKPYASATLLASVATVLEQRQHAARRRSAVATIVSALEQLRAEEVTHIDTTMMPMLQALPHATDTPQTVLRVGALQIDRLRHEVRWNEQRIAVTPTQFKLLCCLAERADQVVPGSDIVAYTHGSNVSNDEALLLLKSHVRNLRRRIDPDYLTNQRGYGYRLAVPHKPQAHLIGVLPQTLLRERAVGAGQEQLH
jgi:DNA-binding response OmpR family regulator